MLRIFHPLLIITFSLFSVSMSSQNPAAYKIFTGEGKSADWNDLVKKASKADVVYFGELHNNAVAHWLQLVLAKELANKTDNKLAIGFEMFESDNQRTLDEYFADMISQKNFEAEVRLWPNYKTDYKPVIEWAKSNKIRAVATNVPRRYANLVYRKGLEALNGLTDEAKKDIAPLPISFDINLTGYNAMVDNSTPGHANENLPKAQAIKDATMAHFISQNLIDKGIFLHINGAYHSDNKEGILWYLNKLKPELKQFTISTVSQENIDKLDEEHNNKADFIIAVPDDFTNTH